MIIWFFIKKYSIIFGHFRIKKYSKFIFKLNLTNYLIRNYQKYEDIKSIDNMMCINSMENKYLK